MSGPERSDGSMRGVTATPLRHPEIYLSEEQLATACGLSAPRLARLVRHGVVEPDPPGSRRFTVTTAARVKRMLRLRADLGVNLAGAMVIVDLLARLERADEELTRLRRFVRRQTPREKETG
jgi:hypothetical protein